MWTYQQSDGELRNNGMLAGHGYSGHGEGLNNHAMEAVPNVGPIPVGMWRIIRWDEHHGNKGPIVAVLEPEGHDAHGRTDFLVHGDNQAMNHTASHGCIILDRDQREAWRESGDMQLEVMA